VLVTIKCTHSSINTNEENLAGLNSNPPPETKGESLTQKSYFEKPNLIGFLKLAPRAGFEPATLRLTGERSTVELPRIIALILAKFKDYSK
jgi:hypothetical protein